MMVNFKMRECEYFILNFCEDVQAIRSEEKCHSVKQLMSYRLELFILRMMDEEHDRFF